MLRRLFLSFLFLTFCASALFGAEVPGGLVRTSDTIKVNTAEFLMSPVVLLSPAAAYLATELRLQANEDATLGAGFGAGEVGFNVGANGMWHLFPDNAEQPGVSFLGGLYFNRLRPDSFLVLKFVPMISKSVKVDWGKLTPYAGFHFSPSFRLNEAANEVSLKTSMGCAFAVKSMNGIRLWTEVGLGLANSQHEVIAGLTYPLGSF